MFIEFRLANKNESIILNSDFIVSVTQSDDENVSYIRTKGFPNQENYHKVMGSLRAIGSQLKYDALEKDICGRGWSC